LVLCMSPHAPYDLLQSSSVEHLPSILRIVTIAVVDRADLVLRALTHVVVVIQASFKVLQEPKDTAGNRGIRGERELSTTPFSISGNDDAVGEADAGQLSRLLVRLANARWPRTNPATTTMNRQRLAAPLAKHAPAILAAYVRAAADPVSALPASARRQLEPGLDALCETITAGGRVTGRGREGEGIGIPFGVGEGGNGAIEREIWSDLWRAWSRRRYVGQG